MTLSMSSERESLMASQYLLTRELWLSANLDSAIICLVDVNLKENDTLRAMEVAYQFQGIDRIKAEHYSLLFSDNGAIYLSDQQQDLLYRTPCLYDDLNDCSDANLIAQFGSVEAVSYLTGLDAWINAFIEKIAIYLQMVCHYICMLMML